MVKLFRQYYPIRNIFFVIGEGGVIFCSVILACKFRMDQQFLLMNIYTGFKISLVTIICLICLYYNDLYNFSVVDNFTELGIRLMQGLGVSAILLAIIYQIFPFAVIGRGVFAISVIFLIIFVFAWRVGYSYILKKGLMNEKIIILGSDDLALKIISEIKSCIDCGYSVFRHIYEGNEKTAGKKYENLFKLAEQNGVVKIVVALKDMRKSFPARELLLCKVKGIEIIEGISFYEMLTGKLVVEKVNPAWLIFSEGFRKTKFQRLVKRIEDLILSLIMLIFLSPVLFLTSILIKIDSRGNILFSQERVGAGRNRYRMYKFRSMIDDAEKKSGPVWAIQNDHRITRVGRVIRKTRIDELPQIWNVLRGDMSFVGPRPEREYFIQQLERKIPYYGERFSVKPGITGWAQVSYGYGASVEDAVEKLNYDLFYIKNMSLMIDLVVLLRTVKIVIFSVGSR